MPPTVICFGVTGITFGQLCRELSPTSLDLPSQPGLNRGSTASTITLPSIILKAVLRSGTGRGLVESPLANALIDLSLCLLIAQDHVYLLKQGDAGCSASKRFRFPRSMNVIRHCHMRITNYSVVKSALACNAAYELC